jgi:hypothetical protein
MSLGMGTDLFTEGNEGNEGKKQEFVLATGLLEIGFIIPVARAGFLVLYSGTRDAKASNWLFDLSVLFLRLARVRSVAV